MYANTNEQQLKSCFVLKRPPTSRPASRGRKSCIVLDKLASSCVLSSSQRSNTRRGGRAALSFIPSRCFSSHTPPPPPAPVASIRRTRFTDPDRMSVHRTASQSVQKNHGCRRNAQLIENGFDLKHESARSGNDHLAKRTRGKHNVAPGGEAEPWRGRGRGLRAGSSCKRAG